MLRCSGSREVEEPEQTQQTNIFQTGWKVNFTIFQKSNRETDHLEHSLHCAYNLKANPNALRCVGELSRIWTARLPGAITTGRGATTTECGIECMLESFDTSWCDDRASALLLQWEMACHFRQDLPGALVRVEDGASFSSMTPRELYRWEMACHFRQELLAIHTHPLTPIAMLCYLPCRACRGWSTLRRGLGEKRAWAGDCTWNLIDSIENGDGMKQSKTNSRYVSASLKLLLRQVFSEGGRMESAMFD